MISVFAVVLATVLAASAGVVDYNAEIRRVSQAGGGRVVVPAGDWETPGLVLKSNVELHLEKGARLLFATNLSAFLRLDVPRCEGCTHALVSAVGVTNVAITGEGELVGRGESWPQPVPRRPRLIRPKGVVFANCRDIRLSDFLLRDSPSWGVVFKCCDGVVARRVRIDSHANANNDGFDIEARNVLLEYCDVDSGDDAYCLKSNDPDFVMENVTVRGCIGRSNCNGFKIGTASHGTVRRVRFENCLTEAPRRSFVSRVDAPSAPKAGEEWFRFNRTREWPGGPEHLAGMAALAVECVDGGEVSDVVCSGLIAYGMMTPIFIRGGERTGRETPAGTKYVLKDIRVEGCVAVAESFVPSSVTGSGRCRPENVLLKNVRIRVKPNRAPCPDAEIPELPGKYPEANMFGLLPAHGLYARHVTGLKLDDVVFEAVGDTRPRVRTEDVTDFSERPHPPGKRVTDPDLSRRWLGDAKRDARIRAKRVEQLANAGCDYDAVWLGDSIAHRWESEAGRPEFERSFGERPNLVVGVVSDPHANSPENNRYLRKALEYFRARQVDAVAIPGDFGFVAKHGELLASSRTWFDVFPDDRLSDGRKVERIFITGNHDEDGWRYGKPAKDRYAGTTPEESAFAFNRQKFWREAWHEDYTPVFTKTVKGYTFVCRHWLPLKRYADNPALAWFAAHGAELPADRPFFYLQHEALTGATAAVGRDGASRVNFGVV